MIRRKVGAQFESLLKSAQRLADLSDAAAVVLLADDVFNFKAVRKLLRGTRLVVASDDEEIQNAVREDEVDLVPILHEPQTRSTQVSQVLLEAIADEILQSGDTIVAVYSSYDNDRCDTVSAIELSEQLARLTSRDLQRLETQMPLETLRQVVDLACDLGREGREGKPVGTIFVVGNHRKVLSLSQEQVHDPFRSGSYPQEERLIRNPRVRESIKELSQVDGAFVISSEGVVQGFGRHLRASADGLALSKGLGSRHWAAAEMSKATDAVAVVVSESTGTVRIFLGGKIVLRIEPLDAAMKWQDVDTEPPADPG